MGKRVINLCETTIVLYSALGILLSVHYNHPMADMEFPLPTVDSIQIPDTCRETFVPLSDAACRPLVDMGMLLAGYSEFGDGYCVQRTSPKFNLHLITVDGAGSCVFLDDREQLRRERVERDTVFLAPAGKPYAYRPLIMPWKAVWFHFDNSTARDSRCAKNFAIRPFSWAARVAATMRDLLVECADARHETGMDVALLYARILAARLDAAATTEIDDDRRRIRRVLDPLWSRVSSGLHEAWPIARLAEISGYSSTHFARMCRSAFDGAPARILLMLRMERARALLTGTDYPVGVVGELVGYRDPFAFSTAFRREVGMSPRAYRGRGS